MLIKAADDAAGTEADHQRLVRRARRGRRPAAGAAGGGGATSPRGIPKVLIVASAGNDGTDGRFYPGRLRVPGVKAVGALNADLTGADFSNRGDWVHCSAVGVGVVSTFVHGHAAAGGPTSASLTSTFVDDDAWATWSGTSFTAPQISGAVAHLCAAGPPRRCTRRRPSTSSSTDRTHAGRTSARSCTCCPAHRDRPRESSTGWPRRGAPARRQVRLVGPGSTSSTTNRPRRSASTRRARGAAGWRTSMCAGPSAARGGR